MPGCLLKCQDLFEQFNCPTTGVGLPGLLAALLGDAFFMLTDYDPQVVPVTHAGIPGRPTMELPSPVLASFTIKFIARHAIGHCKRLKA